MDFPHHGKSEPKWIWSSPEQFWAKRPTPDVWFLVTGLWISVKMRIWTPKMDFGLAFGFPIENSKSWAHDFARFWGLPKSGNGVVALLT